jgi:hypothetical protein
VIQLPLNISSWFPFLIEMMSLSYQLEILWYQVYLPLLFCHIYVSKKLIFPTGGAYAVVGLGRLPQNTDESRSQSHDRVVLDVRYMQPTLSSLLTLLQSPNLEPTPTSRSTTVETSPAWWHINHINSGNPWQHTSWTWPLAIAESQSPHEVAA